MEPEGYIIIPDTHGFLGSVERLLARLKHDGWLRQRKLVFLGDYVDRGPRVPELLDLCIALKQDGHIFLAGNHEYVLSRVIQPDAHHVWVERWLTCYQEGVLEVYGVRRRPSDASLKLASRLRDQMPLAHQEFLAELPLVFEAPGLVCVHAGLDPEQPLEAQLQMLRTKDIVPLQGPPQLFSHALATLTNPTVDACVVSGHCIREVPYISAHRILLHGGVELNGTLNAWITDARQLVTV